MDVGSDPVHGVIVVFIAIIIYAIWASVSPDSLEKHITSNKVVPYSQGKDEYGHSLNPGSRRSRQRARRRRLEEKYNLGLYSLYHASDEEMDKIEPRKKK